MSSTPVKTHRAPQIILTVLLWLLAAVLGLAAVYYLHEISFVAYALYLSVTKSQVAISENYTGVLIGQITVFVGAIAWLVAIIGLGEYQLKHSGEPKAWKIFGWILGIEILLIVIGLLVS